MLSPTFFFAAGLLATSALAANSTTATATKVGATFAQGQKFQIILDGTVDVSGASVNPDAQVWDLDVYDTDAATISKLKSLGKTVICYFSAGTYENWRADASQFTASDKGKALPDWPGEQWLRLNSTNVRSIMKNRIAYAAQKGCDAIDPDNTDGYDNDNGLGLTSKDSIDYMTFLANTAATYNLKIGLKNSGGIIASVANLMDFAVNEECAKYSECALYGDFLASGKPVFHIEYPSKIASVSSSQMNTFCNASGASKMTTVLKDIGLDGRVVYCDGSTANISGGSSTAKSSSTSTSSTRTSTTSSTRSTTSSTTFSTSTRPATTSSTTTSAAPSCTSVSVTLQQCGGSGFSGCTTCPSGQSCQKLSSKLSVCF